MNHILSVEQHPVTPNGSQSHPPASPQPERERIAATAYYLFLGNGRQHGLDVQDWLAAEAQVASQGLSANRIRRFRNRS